MKINKVKLLVGTLAVVATAATVGSISGTVAWFQYSTRSTAAYQGAAAHCSESLQIRIRADEADGQVLDNDWHQDLTAAMINAYLTDTAAHKGAARPNNKLAPVSSQALATNAVPTAVPPAPAFYKNPIYQFTDKATWLAANATTDYIVIPLQLRVLDVDGTGTNFLGNKNIYISDLTLMARADHDSYVEDNHLDFTEALRVAVTAGQSGSMAAYTTFSNSGTDVNVYGELDLNNDGEPDRARKYEWEAPGDPLVYGDNGQVAKSTSVARVNSPVKGVVNDATPNSITGVPIGATDNSLKTLDVDLTIYLEGWTSIVYNEDDANFKDATHTYAQIIALDSPTVGDVYKASDKNNYYRYTAGGWQLVPSGVIWDDVQGVGAEFNVGIRFSTELHQASE